MTVLLYVSPWVISGEDGYVRIHDSLDSLMAAYAVIDRHGFWFTPNLEFVGPIFDTGLPRIAYPNERNAVSLMFALFEPYWAYVAYQLLLRVLGFLGAFALVRATLPETLPHRWLICTGVAVCHACLPFWAWTGAAALLPWVAYVGVRIWRGRFGLQEVLILALYPLFSALLLTGAFLVAAFWGLVIVMAIARRSLFGPVAAALTLTAAFITVDFRVVSFALGEGLLSHRAEFAAYRVPLAAAWQEAWNHFLNGNANAPSLHRTVVLPLTIVVATLTALALATGPIRRQVNARRSRLLVAGIWLAVLVGLALLISLVQGGWNWEAVQAIAAKFPVFNQFNPTRVYFANSFAWMGVFMASLSIIAIGLGRFAFLPILALIAGQLSVEISHHEYRAEKNESGVSFHAFFAPELFDQIAAALPADKSSYRVGSIGIHPSIALYNGFQTADGYVALYPLEYKVRFRQAVQAEFRRKPDLESYFEGWGSRVYFFSSEQTCPRNGAVCTKANPIADVHLNYDPVAVRALGVRYLFSIFKISNADALGFRAIGRFDEPHSAWALWVYEVL